MTPTILQPVDLPRHRFDDPDGIYGVRYFGSTLRGALVEVFDQFRTHPTTEHELTDVSEVEGGDVLSDERSGRVPEKWLASQFIAVGKVRDPVEFIDVMEEELLSKLNLRPRIRQILDSDITAFGAPPTLNFGSVQSSGVSARKLTQAVSREIHEDPDLLAGIRFSSRFCNDETCWAAFEGRADIIFDPSTVSRLDPLNAEHVQAVRSAAEVLRLDLPPNWS